LFVQFITAVIDFGMSRIGMHTFGIPQEPGGDLRRLLPGDGGKA